MTETGEILYSHIDIKYPHSIHGPSTGKQENVFVDKLDFITEIKDVEVRIYTRLADKSDISLSENVVLRNALKEQALNDIKTVCENIHKIYELSNNKMESIRIDKSEDGYYVQFHPLYDISNTIRKTIDEKTSIFDLEKIVDNFMETNDLNLEEALQKTYDLVSLAGKIKKRDGTALDFNDSSKIGETPYVFGESLEEAVEKALETYQLFIEEFCRS